MRIGEYREVLQGQDIPADAVEERMAIVGDFARFLTDLG